MKQAEYLYSAAKVQKSMKELLQQYAAYHVWANQKLFDRIQLLGAEAIQQEIVSSFPSIYKTVLHMWFAEEAWWQRLKLTEHPDMAATHFTGDFAEMVKLLNRQSLIWKEWVTNASLMQLEHVFAYRNTKKEEFKQPVFEMLLHLYNHGTYHRGQLVTMLRQLGADKIPATDFIGFARKS